MTPDKIMVQVRLPRDLVRLVDHFAIDHDLYRAEAFARLLQTGLNGYDYAPDGRSRVGPEGPESGPR